MANARWFLLYLGLLSYSYAFTDLHAKHTTEPFNKWGKAPNKADLDDPAIYVKGGLSLIIVAVKDAGLAVYSTKGELLQFVAPKYRPIVTASDPPTPAGVNEKLAVPCPESQSGESFSRYNGVDILYNVANIGMDVAVVTDRGCDVLHFFAIANCNDGSFLTDVTSDDVARIFPYRTQHPSMFQPHPENVAGTFPNPLDDQSTAYGVTAFQDSSRDFVIVTQRSRSAASQLVLGVTNEGKITYSRVRLYLFDMHFNLTKTDGSSYLWTPCRDEPNEEDPQAEGVVVDAANNVLYIAFESCCIYRIHLSQYVVDDIVHVPTSAVVIRAKHFGRGYWTKPKGGKLKCNYGIEPSTEGSVVVEGSDEHVGLELHADIEGLTLVDDKLLLVSSQGDSTFHVYENNDTVSYVGGFSVAGVTDTDGLEVVTEHAGDEFPSGLLAVHNGKAPVLSDTPRQIGGYKLKGATQLMLVDWSDVHVELYGFNERAICKA